MFLEALPDGFANKSGQGGEGALAIGELWKVLRIDSSKPLIRPASILHTDSAKAYRRVGPLRWNPESVLLTEFQDQPDFLKFKWVHTTVMHKRKPGMPIRYVESAEIVMHDGTVKQVEKGSKKIDGYWATMRRCVGKTGDNRAQLK